MESIEGTAAVLIPPGEELSVALGEENLAVRGTDPDRAVLWNAHIKATKPRESSFRKVMAAFFKEQFGRALSVFDSLSDEKATDPDTELLDLDDEDEALGDVLLSLMEEEIDFFGNQTMTELEDSLKAAPLPELQYDIEWIRFKEELIDIGKFDFDLSDPEVAKWLKRWAAAKLTKINGTTISYIQAAIRRELAAGVEEGETITELRDRIRSRIEATGKMSRNVRARTIARTEVNAAANFAKGLAWSQSNVVEEKEWLSARDSDVRTKPDSEFDHDAADGEKVSLKEKFQKTGEALDHPGDPAGSAGNLVNCRCDQLAVLKKPEDLVA